MLRHLSLVLPLVLFACGSDDKSPSDTADTSDTTDTTDTTPAGPAWDDSLHPCPGINRTDALWADEDGTLWLGCGSGTDGKGLFLSTDGGANWGEPSTSPRDFFSTWRVLSISRSADGFLYVAGTNTVNANQMVVRIVAGGAVEEVYTAPSPTPSGTKFVAGGFRRLSDGKALIESLTGNDVLMRRNDADTWLHPLTSNVYSDSSSHQILDLTASDTEFFASGSTISEPPLYFGPALGGPLVPVQFNAVQLATGIGAFDGEMWAIAEEDGTVVVGGVDQGLDVGRFFVGPKDGSAFTGFYADELASGRTNPTIVRGACVRDGVWVVVGEENVSTGVGFVLTSTDGATWTDITPPNAPTAISRCVVAPDGTIVVAGADNFVAWYH